jgi:pimeloyl-ACP methyl ester carboxylesterase
MTNNTDSSRIRWAGLSGREQGEAGADGPALVLLHGLTFNRRMWYPALDALPARTHAIAFDLPGHGGSDPLAGRGLAPAVSAVHEAVLEAGLAAPIVVGHSIGGPIAALYGALHPASGVVSIEAPMRFEPFAEHMRSLAPMLTGDGFDRTWASYRAGWRLDLLTDAERGFLDEQASQELVTAYQADILDGPFEAIVARRDEGLSRLRTAGTPFVSLYATEVDRQERAFLAERLPQAEIAVWHVGHHFPHLSDPARFARLLERLARVSGEAARRRSRSTTARRPRASSRAPRRAGARRQGG